MGCDIHVIVESMDEGTEQAEWMPVHPAPRFARHWAPYEWSIDRDYCLFARLAGVRDDNPRPLTEPRGMPPGISKLAEFILVDDPDMHTHTWYSLPELAGARERESAERPSDFWNELVPELLRWYSGNTRVLIAFDN